MYAREGLGHKVEFDSFFAVTPEQLIKYRQEYYGGNYSLTNDAKEISIAAHARMEEGKSYDLLYFLRQSPKEVFGKSTHFPRTYEILGGVDGFYIIHNNSGILNAFIVVQGRVIEVKRRLLGSNPNDATYGNWKEYDREMLPDEIKRGFYHNINGLIVLREPMFQDVMGGFLLPAPRGGEWPAIEDLCKRHKLNKKDVFYHLINKTGASENVDYFAFLNTYRDVPDDKSSQYKGDYFFVSSESPNKEIYHIKDADYENVKILRNYCEAIDLYCEHVLQNNDGRFDFSPFVEDF